MEVTNNFKMYLPNDYINSNYSYNLDNQYILVNTHTNCFTQYNTTYCDCFRVYPNYNYIKSDTYSCSINNNYNTSYQSFSSNIFNMPNIANNFIVYFIIIIIFVYILNKLIGIFRKRLK